jgi:hypothetical protein
MKDLPIIVFGATGYTGRLLCEPRPGDSSAASPPEIRVADVADRASLARLLEPARVVVNCVGPFLLYGLPVLEAALAAQTHYLDISGEYPFMLETHRRHDEALRRDVVLVNGVGFDVIPTDVAAVLAATAFQEEGGAAVEQVDIAFGARGRVSRGTARSMLQGLAQGRGSGAAFVAGRFIEEPLGDKIWGGAAASAAGPADLHLGSVGRRRHRAAQHPIAERAGLLRGARDGRQGAAAHAGALGACPKPQRGLCAGPVRRRTSRHCLAEPRRGLHHHRDHGGPLRRALCAIRLRGARRVDPDAGLRRKAPARRTRGGRGDLGRRQVASDSCYFTSLSPSRSIAMARACRRDVQDFDNPMLAPTCSSV